MNPNDYSGAFADVKPPQEAFINSFKDATAIRAFQTQQQQQAQQAQVINSLISNKNAGAEDYSKAMLLVPGMKDQLKQAWDTKSTAQQQQQLSDLSQWGAAIQNGKPEIAVNAMRDRADAMENAAGAPTQESQALRAHADSIEAHPEYGGFMIKSVLAAHPDGSKVIDSISKLGEEQRAEDQAPADLKKKIADASKAATDAQVAAGTVPAQLQKPLLDNEKTVQDIAASKSGQDIAALNVQIAQANSETERGRLTLERDKMVAEQALKKQTVGTDTQNQMDTIGQSLETVKSLQNDPLLDSSFFGVGSTNGKLLSMIPGTANKDFRARVETLKSQQFLTAAKDMKGLGALSDAEGARIERAVASLDTDQSVTAFKNALGVIQKTLEKGQAKIVASGKLPTAGGAFIATVPGIGNVSEGDINRLLAKNPGSTREQVMAYLKAQADQQNQIPK